MFFRFHLAGTASLHGSLAARGSHDVSITATGAVLLDRCPELRRASNETADGAVCLPYGLVLRLALPLVGPKRRADRPHEWRAKIWRFTFSPSALGSAVAAVVASAHFDGTRTYTTVASLAAALRIARDKMVVGGEDVGSLLIDFQSMLHTGVQLEDEDEATADARALMDDVASAA